MVTFLLPQQVLTYIVVHTYNSKIKITQKVIQDIWFQVKGFYILQSIWKTWRCFEYATNLYD